MVDDERTRIAAWWQGLDEFQSRQAREHLHGDLPEDLARSLLAARVTVTGAKWGAGAGYSFRMPAAVAAFVEERGG